MEIANVLIVEHGADWSNCSAPLTPSGRTLVVFVQQPDESQTDFRSRVQRRIGRMKMKAAEWFFLARKSHAGHARETGVLPGATALPSG